MRYSFRTLLIVLGVGPPAIWFAVVTLAIIADGMRPTAVPALRGIEYGSRWDLPYENDAPPATNSIE